MAPSDQVLHRGRGKLHLKKKKTSAEQAGQTSVLTSSGVRRKKKTGTGKQNTHWPGTEKTQFYDMQRWCTNAYNRGGCWSVYHRKSEFDLALITSFIKKNDLSLFIFKSPKEKVCIGGSYSQTFKEIKL